MKTKHTPAPWLSTFTIQKKRGVRSKEGFICFLPDVTHYSGQDERYEQELEERKANAQLISAAPDLLSALNIVYNHPRGVPFSSNVLDLIKSALIKAGCI